MQPEWNKVKSAFNISRAKPVGNRPLGRPRLKQENAIGYRF